MITRQLVRNLIIENEITKLAQEETGKRQYYRPVYSLHKWWARRSGTLFRSIILMAAFPDSTEQLFQYDKENLIPSKSAFFTDHNLRNMTILDPFMGGGTTLVEGNRMGAKVVGCDLNPVSYWVVRETLKPIDLKKLKSYFSELEKNAGKSIKSLYMTHCSKCNSEDANILYAFWVRYIECPKCKQNVYLFKRYFLNEGEKRTQKVSKTNPAMVICPSCHSLNNFYGDNNCKCAKCGMIFHPKDKVFDAGFFSCPNCSSERLSLINTIRQGYSLKEKLFAIEYYCSECRERLYKSPDSYDISKISDIQRDFEEKKEDLIFPKQYIPDGSTSARWIAHNFRQYYNVFNARQILSFNYLFSAINQIPEEEYRNAFITIFSNSLEYNNMMTPYNYPHRKLHHLFNYHALPLTTTPVENNVWGILDKGAGTYTNCYQRYVKAKEYCQKPFDKFKQNGEINTFFSDQEIIHGKFVSNFEELKATDRGALLHCGDSANLSFLPDKSVDAVITDPPYFDNIHYSELSNFFYVWLRLFNKNHYFTTDHVTTDQEAIVNVGMDKTEEDYCRLITSVFSECARVLKDNGKMVFTFHHSKPRAWWTILRAIVDAGFIITDYFPVTSEYKVNPHLRGKNAIDTDLVIVCEKRQIQKSLFDDEIQFNFDIIIEQTVKRINYLYNGNLNIERLYFYYIGELLRVGSQSKSVSVKDFERVFQQSDEFANIIREKYPEKTTKTQKVDYEDLPLFSGLL